jgi:predicted RNase H-like nuclease
VARGYRDRLPEPRLHILGDRAGSEGALRAAKAQCGQELGHRSSVRVWATTILAAVAIFAGIDLAWTSAKRSGICLLEGDTSGLALSLVTSRKVTPPALAAWLASLGAPLVAGIDAPLLVGPERTAEREVGRVFGRYKAAAHSASATLLARERRDAGPTLGQDLRERRISLDPGALRPLGPGRFALEVYPHALHIAWFSLGERLRYKRKRGRRLPEIRVQLIEYQSLLTEEAARCRLELPRSGCTGSFVQPEATRARGAALKDLEDQLDALTCALAAFRAWRDGLEPVEILGSFPAGYVAVPGLRFDPRLSSARSHALGGGHAHELENAGEGDPGGEDEA